MTPRGSSFPAEPAALLSQLNSRRIDTLRIACRQAVPCGSARSVPQSPTPLGYVTGRLVGSPQSDGGGAEATSL